MGLSQQQVASQDTIDYGNYLQPSHNRKVLGSINDRYQLQNNQNLKQDIRDHNTSFTSTKGLLNGPGQNNCFLNSAVQVIKFMLYFHLMCTICSTVNPYNQVSYEEFLFQID